MKNSFGPSTSLVLLLASCSLTAAQEPNYNTSSVLSTVVARQQDSSSYTVAVQVTDGAGVTSVQTNRFTILENSLNYQDESGNWRQSEDLIEPFREGAIAQRGPSKAIFSNQVDSENLFDIQAPDGKRLRGGVRAILLTDTASGLSVSLAEVKPGAAGELLPPNQIVYRDAFEGEIKADVLLVWRHNSFAQDVILRSRPVLPAEMDPATTRLEVVTEFIQPPQPELRNGMGEVEDHALINFGTLAIITGYAYAVEGGASLGHGGDERRGATVTKQWENTPDGRTFLVESIKVFLTPFTVCGYPGS